MRYRKQIERPKITERCTKIIEILHTEGIESAQAWLNDARKNDLYDYIEYEYLKTRKVIFIN